MSTDAKRLNQPFPGIGSARTYFFNGRLLAAEDLKREQTLRETGQAQLARIIGCGIERGLIVQGTTGNSLLQVSGGIGIAPSGWVCETADFDIDLSAAGSGKRSSGFANCATSVLDLRTPTAGLYLLVLSPAWIADGRAPTLLGEVGVCNRNTEQPALRARLLSINIAGEPIDTLRNRLALALLAPTPGSPDGLVGWLPKSVVPSLSADDLPLAALQIDSQAKLVFLDLHAARRRLAPPPGGEQDVLWADSQALEMEAFAQQFLFHLLDVHDNNLGPAFLEALDDVMHALSETKYDKTNNATQRKKLKRQFFSQLKKLLTNQLSTHAFENFAQILFSLMLKVPFMNTLITIIEKVSLGSAASIQDSAITNKFRTFGLSKRFVEYVLLLITQFRENPELWRRTKDPLEKLISSLQGLADSDKAAETSAQKAMDVWLGGGFVKLPPVVVFSSTIAGGSAGKPNLALKGSLWEVVSREQFAREFSDGLRGEPAPCNQNLNFSLFCLDQNKEPYLLRIRAQSDADLDLSNTG